jgi:hypothetical protein
LEVKAAAAQGEQRRARGSGASTGSGASSNSGPANNGGAASCSAPGGAVAAASCGQEATDCVQKVEHVPRAKDARGRIAPFTVGSTTRLLERRRNNTHGRLSVQGNRG